MKHQIGVLAPLAAAAAGAHDGHGLHGAHGHASDAWGYGMAAAVAAALLFWRGRR